MPLDLGTAPPTTVGGTCLIGAWLRDNPTDAPTLRGYLTDDAWTAQALADALKTQGHTIGAQVITRHRGQRCKCIERGLA